MAALIGPGTTSGFSSLRTALILGGKCVAGADTETLDAGGDFCADGDGRALAMLGAPNALHSALGSACAVS